jgi:hypothetical protein
MPTANVLPTARKKRKNNAPAWQNAKQVENK